MAGFEEETYSTIFTSLNHSVRRKILKMLSEGPRSFSDMFESLGISSSLFNYHLENLGELVSKAEDGKYRLSFLGEAAMATMSKVEETPKSSSTKNLPGFLVRNWKPLVIVLLVAVGFFASFSILQSISMNELTTENLILEGSNDLLWDSYTNLLVSSDNSPPNVTKSEAIQKALQYGKWDPKKLEGKMVDASIVYFKFETRTLEVTVLNNEIISEIPIARLYEVTGSVSDYKPVIDEDSTYRYIWEISVRSVDEYLENNFSATPLGIYHIDAVEGTIYPNLYSLVYIDVDN